MSGQDESIVQQHPFCPEIFENCCSLDDAIRSKFLWNNQSKFILERYYQTYLITVKYLLGFTQEGYLLGRKYETKGQKKCKKAAVDLISMNLNIQTTQMIYDTLEKSARDLSVVRKGFYCIICDGVQ